MAESGHPSQPHREIARFAVRVSNVDILLATP